MNILNPFLSAKLNEYMENVVNSISQNKKKSIMMIIQIFLILSIFVVLIMLFKNKKEMKILVICENLIKDEKFKEIEGKLHRVGNKQIKYVGKDGKAVDVLDENDRLIASYNFKKKNQASQFYKKYVKYDEKLK